MPVLTVEGQVDLLLKKWEPVKGIANIIEANKLMSEQYENLKRKTERELK